MFSINVEGKSAKPKQKPKTLKKKTAKTDKIQIKHEYRKKYLKKSDK